MARILVVDDEEGIRSFIADSLDADGIALITLDDPARTMNPVLAMRLQFELP